MRTAHYGSTAHPPRTATARPAPHHPDPRDSVWPRVLTAAQDLVPLTQPAVVLASLAALSVPTFSEGCHILIQEHEHDVEDTDDAPVT